MQNRVNNITGLSPELKIRLGNLLIRPVASFGWGDNFLDIKKGVDNNLRAEASSPAYRTHWIPLISRL